MAVIPSDSLAKMRNSFGSNILTGTVTKPQINAILQSVEDWFEANRASLGAAVNVAAQAQLGQNLTGTQIKTIVKFWLQSKFDRE